MAAENGVVSSTIQEYNRTAEAYAERDQWKIVIPFAERFMEYLPGNRVLDLGCGPGHHLKWFTGNGLDATGVDLAAAFVRIARRNVPQATVKQMDCRNLDFEDESFDGVWANAVLLHLKKEDATAAVEEMRRVLRPDGVVFISVKQGSGERFVERDGMERFFSFYREEEVKTLLEDADLKIIAFEKVETDRTVWLDVFARK